MNTRVQKVKLYFVMWYSSDRLRKKKLLQLRNNTLLTKIADDLKASYVITFLICSTLAFGLSLALIEGIFKYQMHVLP